MNKERLAGFLCAVLSLQAPLVNAKTLLTFRQAVTQPIHAPIPPSVRRALLRKFDQFPEADLSRTVTALRNHYSSPELPLEEKQSFDRALDSGLGLLLNEISRPKPGEPFELAPPLPPSELLTAVKKLRKSDMRILGNPEKRRHEIKGRIVRKDLRMRMDSIRRAMEKGTFIGRQNHRDLENLTTVAGALFGLKVYKATLPLRRTVGQSFRRGAREKESRVTPLTSAGGLPSSGRLSAPPKKTVHGIVKTRPKPISRPEDTGREQQDPPRLFSKTAGVIGSLLGLSSVAVFISLASAATSPFGNSETLAGILVGAVPMLYATGAFLWDSFSKDPHHPASKSNQRMGAIAFGFFGIFATEILRHRSEALGLLMGSFSASGAFLGLFLSFFDYRPRPSTPFEESKQRLTRRLSASHQLLLLGVIFAYFGLVWNFGVLFSPDRSSPLLLLLMGPLLTFGALITWIASRYNSLKIRQATTLERLRRRPNPAL